MGKVDLKIALTGAMGSGKSVVADIFRQQGARIVDADEIARQLLQPSQKGWCAIQASFGDQFFNNDLTLDRKRFRRAIFGDEILREKVNGILHPLIRNRINEICAEEVLAKSDSPEAGTGSVVTIIEVPLLFEVGWQTDFDQIIVVSADEKTCLRRVMSRDGDDLKAAKAAYATQMNLSEKAEQADYVIDNNGDLAATSQQVKDLYHSLSSSPV